MMPDADRGNAPRSALSTSRTPRWSARSSDRATTPPDRPSWPPSGGPLRGMSSARTQGFAPAPGPAARQRPSGRGRVAPEKLREAAEEVGPRRGHQAHGRNERFATRKGVERNGPVLGATPRSRGLHWNDVTTASRQRGAAGASPSGAVQRHGGRTGGGDTVRLGTGGTLRRVEASRGTSPSRQAPGQHPRGAGAGTMAAGCGKRGEPQDRQRDATSPRSFARRKPARWCETTWSEREAGRVVPSAPGLFGAAGVGSSQGPGPGVDARRRRRWRGGSYEPQERQGPGRAVRSFGSGRWHREGPGKRADASKESGNDPEADCGCLHPEALPRPCPRGPRTGDGRRPRRAQERPPTCSPRDSRRLRPSGFAGRPLHSPRRSPDSTEAVLALAHRSSGRCRGPRAA
jgi:hypothetical protein